MQGEKGGNAIREARSCAPFLKTSGQERQSAALATDPIRLGGLDYELFLHPVPIAAAGKEGGSRRRFYFCGLMREEQFRALSTSVSVAAFTVVPSLDRLDLVHGLAFMKSIL